MNGHPSLTVYHSARYLVSWPYPMHVAGYSGGQGVSHPLNMAAAGARKDVFRPSVVYDIP